MQPPPVIPAQARYARRNAVTLKLLFIAGLILLLQVPLFLVNGLRGERSRNRTEALARLSAQPRPGTDAPTVARVATVIDSYRMVERALKHGVLVMAMVFAAFFLFEVVGGLRLHAVHYGLVGAALCLFYLALLALGEVFEPGPAYVSAAAASSTLVVLYSAAILRCWLRAAAIAGLLAAVHSVLFVVLRMEDFALLAGTGALFAALAAVMYFTRHIDWQAQDAGTPPASEGAR